MTDLLPTIALISAGAIALGAFTTFAAKFVSAIRRRRRARLWAPALLLTQHVFGAFTVTQAEVTQLDHKLSAGLGRANAGITNLRRDLRDWTFQVFMQNGQEDPDDTSMTESTQGSHPSTEASPTTATRAVSVTLAVAREASP